MPKKGQLTNFERNLSFSRESEKEMKMKSENPKTCKKVHTAQSDFISGF